MLCGISPVEISLITSATGITLRGTRGKAVPVVNVLKNALQTLFDQKWTRLHYFEYTIEIFPWSSTDHHSERPDAWTQTPISAWQLARQSFQRSCFTKQPLVCEQLCAWFFLTPHFALLSVSPQYGELTLVFVVVVEQTSSAGRLRSASFQIGWAWSPGGVT